MQLNLPTLILADIYVLVLVAVLMLFAWRSGRRESTLGYLSLMLFLGGASTVLGAMRNLGVDFLPIVIGNVLFMFAVGLNWTAMRVFAGRRPHWALSAGALVWVLLCLLPSFYESLRVRIMVHSAITIIYTGLAMYELLRCREHIEVSLRPAKALMALHIGMYGLRILFDQGHPFEVRDAEFSFFSLLIFETMLYAIGIAFVSLAMVRERAELEYRHASLSDPLTGVGNRRAFIEQGEALLATCRSKGRPATLLLCDLDHFKRLNDTLGHQAGDQALVGFCQVMKLRMRREDVFGRIGGEEFACLLFDAGATVGQAVAERIRTEFAELPFTEGAVLSVSIGVSTAERVGYDLDRLLSDADHALYEAKNAGRNCTRIAGRSVLPSIR